jgi:hypothetical protein
MGQGQTYNAVDEGRDEALGITVARAVEGTAGVQFALAASGLHLGEIQGAVHAARQLGGVDFEADLIAGELHHLILALGLVEQVDPWRHEVAVDQLLQAQRGALCSHTVGTVIGDALYDAVLGA